MTRLHPVRARGVIRFLESLDFAQSRQRCSYRFFRHPDGRTATVTDHGGEDLRRGILAKILRDAESTPGEFLAWFSRQGEFPTGHSSPGGVPACNVPAKPLYGAGGVFSTSVPSHTLAMAQSPNCFSRTIS